MGSGGFQASFAYQNDIIRTHDVDCRVYVFPVAPFVAVLLFYFSIFFLCAKVQFMGRGWNQMECTSCWQILTGPVLSMSVCVFRKQYALYFCIVFN